MLHTTLVFLSLELYLFSYQYIDVLVISPCPFPFLPRKAHTSDVLFHAKQSRLWISSKRSRRPIFILERCHCKCSKCAERQRNYAYGSRVTAVTSVNPASLMTETITLKLDASRPRRFHSCQFDEKWPSQMWHSTKAARMTTGWKPTLIGEKYNREGVMNLPCWIIYQAADNK